jgi:hypothetical protein
MIASPQAINCSAELHSAVSQIFNLRNVREHQRSGKSLRPAECDPAIQQIENLRYFASATQTEQTFYNGFTRGAGNRCRIGAPDKSTLNL